MRTLLVILFCLPAFAPAQKTKPPALPVVYVSVSGTVTCTDTGLPARLTPVTLQPVKDRAPAGEGEPHAAEPLLETFETRLDGSFLMPRVPVGRYYVIVQKPGYLSPAGLFTKAEIEWPSNPADNVSDAVAKTVPLLTVTANQGSSLDLRLVRAAAISGVMKFDDGTAASTQYVIVQRKGPKGDWVSTNLGGRRGSGMTDDQGRYRIAGVPAGEYRMYTALELSRVVTNAVFGTSSSSSGSTQASVRVYFGDTFYAKQARVLKVEEGQEIVEDLTIPNSRLHAVSGMLVDARSGKTINAGTVRLAFAEDEGGGVSAAVDEEDPTFLLPFVPEGNYTVRVSDAREVTRTPIVLPENTISSERFRRRWSRATAPTRGR